eukprot:jgi/Mesvir1/16551/Mv10092-RA.1
MGVLAHVRNTNFLTDLSLARQSCARLTYRPARAPAKFQPKCTSARNSMEPAPSLHRFSQRIEKTDDPVIVKTGRWMQSADGVLSLAQGIVHWKPPESALTQASAAVTEISSSKYCPDDGLPELRAALVKKLRDENGLTNSSVMVTAGANQAFTNVVLALCDNKDSVVMFAPYYFNHMMAFQMTGLADRVIVGPTVTATNLPDTDWLERLLAESEEPPAMVTVVNPANPTGALFPLETLQRLSVLCKSKGVWLCVDNTYEYFVYDGRRHHTLEGDHIVNIFSFSKAYGMMGWRVGYIAYSSSYPGLGEQLLKTQDTIAICPPVLSQKMALAALQGVGAGWVRDLVASLGTNRACVQAALAPLGVGAVLPAHGAIYFFARLPELPGGQADGAQGDVSMDERVCEWLARKHRVCVIPGSACGAPGCIRIGFANLPTSLCEEAAKRLHDGLTELVTHGMAE